MGSCTVRGWIGRRAYGTDVAGIVRVQALARRRLAQRVARWERGRRCGPQLSLELVALVRVQCLLLFWPWHLISYTCKRCERPL